MAPVILGIFCVLGGVLTAAPNPTLAQRAGGTWNEERVRHLARERFPQVRVALARAQRARAAAAGLGLPENPSLSWQRQEAFAPNAQAQDVLTLRVPLDLSGRRGAERALGDFEVALSEADASIAQIDAVAMSLRLFYAAIAQEHRVQLLLDAQASLDEATRIIESRRERGEASGYEVARLGLEAEMGRRMLARARAELSAFRAELHALLTVEPASAEQQMSLVATLLPNPLLSLDGALTLARNRPDMRALARAGRAAARVRDAADLAWVPRLELEGGYNRQDGPLVGHGYALGVSMELPLFDHGQAERAQAAALSADRVADLRRATEQGVEAEVRAAHIQVTMLLAERARFASATEGMHALLLRAAETGYREGARSLLELLDARRAVLESETEAVALDLAARQADIRLRRAMGML